MSVRVFANVDELSRAAAVMIIGLVAESRKRPVSIVLSGGSTPRTLYKLLASPEFSNFATWENVHLFFGDERCVSPTDQASNFRMVDECFLKAVDIPARNVHRICGEETPERAAWLYERQVREYRKKTGSRAFDLVLLGLGTDGHTLSVFPTRGERKCEVHDEVQLELQSDGVYDDCRLIRAVYVQKLKSWRVTMTIELINQAKCVIFLVAGAEKRDVFKAVQGGDKNLPAARVKPEDGKLLFLVDKEAAAGGVEP